MTDEPGQSRPVEEVTTDDGVRCRRCRRVTPGDELDGLLWCEECVHAERKRAALWGRGLAFGAATLLGVWIALTISPNADFRYLYAFVVVVAFVLGARLATELVFGIARVRNVPGAREGTAESDGP